MPRLLRSHLQGASGGPTRASTLRLHCPYLSFLDLSHLYSFSQLMYLEASMEGFGQAISCGLFFLYFQPSSPHFLQSLHTSGLLLISLPLQALVAPGPWACGSLVISSSLGIKTTHICLARTHVIALEASLIIHNEFVI